MDEFFVSLSRSAFRRRFRLTGRDLDSLRGNGLPRTLGQAADILARRVAPGVLPNDGKQTPYCGHPVFVAQHATACCCRGCLQKWHHIPQGRALSQEEISYLLAVLERWFQGQLGSQGTNPELFQ